MDKKNNPRQPPKGGLPVGISLVSQEKIRKILLKLTGEQVSEEVGLGLSKDLISLIPKKSKIRVKISYKNGIESDFVLNRQFARNIGNYFLPDGLNEDLQETIQEYMGKIYSPSPVVELTLSEMEKHKNPKPTNQKKPSKPSGGPREKLPGVAGKKASPRGQETFVVDKFPKGTRNLKTPVPEEKDEKSEEESSDEKGNLSSDDINDQPEERNPRTSSPRKLNQRIINVDGSYYLEDNERYVFELVTRSGELIKLVIE